MTCGIDGNDTEKIKLTLNWDEADVVIAALVAYEIQTGSLMATLHNVGSSEETSLSFGLFRKSGAMAISIGKAMLAHRDIAKLGQ